MNGWFVAVANLPVRCTAHREVHYFLTSLATSTLEGIDFLRTDAYTTGPSVSGSLFRVKDLDWM